MPNIVRIVFLSGFYIFIIFYGDFKEFGTLILIVSFLVILFFQIITLIKRSIYYLFEIRFLNNTCELVIYKYNREHLVISEAIKDIRIIKWETFLPFNRFGRNYKLTIEKVQGLKTNKLITQYEIGNWNKELFDKIINELKEIRKGY